MSPCRRPSSSLPRPRTSSNPDRPLSKFRGGLWVNAARCASVCPSPYQSFSFRSSCFRSCLSLGSLAITRDPRRSCCTRRHWRAACPTFHLPNRIGLAHRIVAHGVEVEDACAEVVALKREHAHATYEYRRVIADLTTRTDGAQAELGAAVRDKDDADATVNSPRERIATLEADSENWEAGPRSAGGECKPGGPNCANGDAARKGPENLQGLNIVLDSEQQELELVSLSLFTVFRPCLTRNCHR